MLSAKYQRTRAIARGQRSSLCEAALADSGSELSKFLLTQYDGNDVRDNDTNKNMPSIKSNRGWTYSLALEPMSIRSERIVMMFEVSSLRVGCSTNYILVVVGQHPNLCNSSLISNVNRRMPFFQLCFLLEHGLYMNGVRLTHMVASIVRF